MNHLLRIEALANRYFVMRHGHSEANRDGLIASHPDQARERYGLTDRGREQVTASLRAQNQLDAETLILSSDFRRALDTAEIAHAMLGCEHPIRIDERLRERFFGAFDLGADSAYREIWRQDALDPDSRFNGIESANQVMARVSDLVRELDSLDRGQRYLLVSHGDALQLLQTAFERQDASTHRQLEHLETAEVRALRLRPIPA